MKWSDLPSLNSLKAFSAAAETGSYSQAGNALNVTHAAISQQVKALEARLGVSLIVRQGRGIALTAEGTALARDLAAGFAAIHGAIERLRDGEIRSFVQVTMSPAFAVSWMLPRIMDFQQQHPGITLMVNPTAEVMELRPGGIDLAIRYREKDRLEAPVETVLIADMVVVGTPGLMGDGQFTDPAMLVDIPWLQELGTNEVADWLARHGVALERPPSITHMPGNLIMAAVRRGDGITYTALPWVETELQSGQLKELFRETAFGVYYLEIGPGVVRAPVRAFVNWLKQQTGTTVTAPA
jgi:LysR family glycine cleavage system transcriptional activator